jgi:hypothetical protein
LSCLAPDTSVRTSGPFRRQLVFFRTNEAPGALVVHTSERFLYVVLGNNKAPLDALPPALSHHALEPAKGGRELVYTYDSHSERSGITALLADIGQAALRYSNLETRQSSLEDIFVNLVRDRS